MKIAVTGISGFLGQQVADFFSKENEVCGISTSGFKKENIVVYDFDQLQLIENPQLIIHCHAAVVSGQNVLSRQTLVEANVSATAKILKQFPSAAHIYISSVAVYGNSLDTINEKTAVQPVSDYANSKYEGEKCILEMEKSAILRLSSLYGQAMKENTLIPNYTNQAIQNKNITVWGTGARMQNYFHISDALQLIKAIVKKNLWNGQIFLGCSANEYSNLDIAQLVSDQTAAQITFVNDDASISMHYDNTFTQNSLNWQPKMAIDTGVKQYVTWKKRQS